MEREPLPNRREMVRFKFTILSPLGEDRVQRENVYLQVGFYPDGRVGEVWLVISKTGAQLRALLDMVAIEASDMLQSGWPLTHLIKRWQGTKFEPAGPVVGYEKVKFCSSPLDAVAKVLEAEFVNEPDSVA